MRTASCQSVSLHGKSIKSWHLALCICIADLCLNDLALVHLQRVFSAYHAPTIVLPMQRQVSRICEQQQQLIPHCDYYRACLAVW